jgi:hypothetical protein
MFVLTIEFRILEARRAMLSKNCQTLEQIRKF